LKRQVALKDYFDKIVSISNFANRKSSVQFCEAMRHTQKVFAFKNPFSQQQPLKE
jgi:hypothetical protein